MTIVLYVITAGAVLLLSLLEAAAFADMWGIVLTPLGLPEINIYHAFAIMQVKSFLLIGTHSQITKIARLTWSKQKEQEAHIFFLMSYLAGLIFTWSSVNILHGLGLF